MKHSKENIIDLIQSIMSSLDNKYDSLSSSSIDYIYSNLKIIHSIISSADKSDTKSNTKNIDNKS